MTRALHALVDLHFPKAEYIRSCWSICRHTPAVLYAAFPSSEARRLLRRIEFHYAPKHASWLNMVDIEIGMEKRFSTGLAEREEEVTIKIPQKKMSMRIATRVGSADANFAHGHRHSGGGKGSIPKNSRSGADPKAVEGTRDLDSTDGVPWARRQTTVHTAPRSTSSPIQRLGIHRFAQTSFMTRRNWPCLNRKSHESVAPGSFL